MRRTIQPLSGPERMLGLIWVQIVWKGYQQMTFPVPQITKQLRGFTIKYEENFERSIGIFSTTHIFAND